MLRWLLGPKCPVNVREKVWTERRMNWLVEQFGIERMLQAEVVLPTPEYFPDHYQGTHDDVRRMLDRLCFYMQIDPARLDLEFFTEQDDPRALGMYIPDERLTIAVRDTEVDDPESLAGVLAHELAHVLLLGDGRLTTETEDHEYLTDLLPVYLGMGIFVANAVLRENLSTGPALRGQGYLAARHYGFAFALFAWRRNEYNPAWKRYLRLDVREPFEQSLHYLRKTGDSFFQPGKAAKSGSHFDFKDLLRALRSDSASVRLNAMWFLPDFANQAPDAVSEIRDCLRHQDPILRSEAAQALASIGPAASPALADLLSIADDPVDEVRASVATALGAIGAPSTEVSQRLSELLSADARDVVAAAARAAAKLGLDAEATGPALVAALRRAIVDCDSGVIDELAAGIVRVSESPTALVRQHLDDDAEIHRLALHAIKTHQLPDDGPDDPEPWSLPPV
jgi:hypothetical protein